MSKYQTHAIEGWTVHVDRKLRSEPTLDESLLLLGSQLRKIARYLPSSAVEHLRTVQLWVSPEDPDGKAAADYHPSEDWLREHGRNVAMAGGVELYRIDALNGIPSILLHELGHAYHDQVLGFDSDEIKEVYENAIEAGLYDDVEHLDAPGSPPTLRRAYAATNEKEYFAESTVAFFMRNSAYPYTRSDLAEHDPEAFELFCRLWDISDDDDTFDDVEAGVCYRIMNYWRGIELSLDIVNDGVRNNLPRLAPTAYTTGQIWYLHDEGEQCYRLTTEWRGEEYSLDATDGQKLVLAPSDDTPEQLWTMTHCGEDHYRLNCVAYGDELSLDIRNDGRNNTPILAPTSNASGQFWKLAEIVSGEEDDDEDDDE